MQIKSLFYVIPMMAPMLITNANASLPDEVNYTPYKLQYDRLAADVDVITQNLNQAEAQLENAYTEEAQTYASIQSLQDDNQRLQNEIDQSLDDKAVLNQNANELQNKLDRLNRRARQFESDKRDVERESRREDRRLQPLRDKVRTLREEKNQVKNRLEKANKRLANVVSNKNKVAGEVSRLQKQRKNLKNAVTILNASLASVDTNIATAKTGLQNAQKQLQAARKNVKTKQDAVNATTTAIQEKSAAMRAIIQELGNPRSAQRDPRVIALRQEIAVLARNKREQDKQLKAAQQAVPTKVKAVNNIKTNIANLEKSKTTIPVQIQQTKVQLQATKVALDNKNVQLATANTNVASAQGEADVQTADLIFVADKLDRKKSKLDAESIVYRDLLSRLDQINIRLNEIDRKLRINNNDYNRTLDQIASIENALPVMRRNIRDNSLSLQRLDTRLATAQNEIIQLNDDVNKLSSQQTMATTSRDRKYEEYISRYNYYSQKLSEAKMVGESQTSVAINAARVDSDQYVDQKSAAMGNQMGAELANAQSSLWASVRAEIKGYNDGYAKGYASDAEQSKGSEAGNAAGIQAANDYAQNTLKPQFFNQMYSSTLNGQNKVLTQAFISSEKMFKLVETQKLTLSEILMDISPISTQELQQSMRTATDLDSSITVYQNNLGQVNNQVQSLSVASNVYEAPTVYDIGSADCSSVYKMIAEFESACNSSYATHYKSKYTTEHYDNFEVQYKSLYEQKVEDVRSETVSAVYDQDYDKFYPTALSSGISAGERQIYKEAYAASYDNAYKIQLPKSTNVAKVDATNEVKSWVENNAALTLSGSSIQAEEIKGGAKVKVAINVKNISPRDLNKPIKVIITNTENAVAESTSYYIKNAKGKSTTEFSEITLNVGSRVRSGQTVKVTGQVVLPGGKYEAERVEAFSASAVTSINPAVKADLDYDSSPRIKSTFGRTYIHNIKMEVSPSVEDIKAGYTIELVAVGEASSLVEIKDSIETTGRINLGSSKDIKFKYTLKKAADNKVLNLNLIYKHNGKVIKTEVLELRPH